MFLRWSWEVSPWNKLGRGEIWEKQQTYTLGSWGQESCNPGRRAQGEAGDVPSLQHWQPTEQEQDSISKELCCGLSSTTKGSSKLKPKEEPAQWNQTNCATEKKSWIWSGQNSESWNLSRLRHQDDARRQNLTHTSQWPWLLMVSISSENTQSSRRDSKNSIQEPNLAFKEMYYLRVQGQKKYSSY